FQSSWLKYESVSRFASLSSFGTHRPDPAFRTPLAQQVLTESEMFIQKSRASTAIGLRGRSMRIFAVTAACLMLFVVADTAIVKAASTDPVLSPQGTDNGAGTAPPPVVAPPPPPDEPQRPVEPGTITQGWDNSSPVSSVDKRDVAMVDTANETMYETAYGYFALTKSAPYFLSVLSPDETGTKIADSACLVMFQGLLLEPKNGRIDKATSSELSFHYELYLAAARE